MTGAEFSGVDIDLLADYVGGALDGTPDQAVVAALIVDDPSWRDAHELLSGGVATVSAQLQALPPEPMPADVIARLDAALSQAGTTADAETPAGGVAPVRQLAAVREKRRWAAPVGVAAAVLAFAGFGWQQLGGDSADQATSSNAGSAQEAPAMDSSGTLALPAGPAEVSTSGTNYSRSTLSQAASRSLAAPAEPYTASSGGARKLPTPSLGALAEADDVLSRLKVQEALLACIDAISDSNGAGEVTAQSVDYARFDGFPAVIVQFKAGNGTWVWAVGPECGTRGGDAAKLGAVQVG